MSRGLLQATSSKALRGLIIAVKGKASLGSGRGGGGASFLGQKIVGRGQPFGGRDKDAVKVLMSGEYLEVKVAMRLPLLACSGRLSFRGDDEAKSLLLAATSVAVAPAHRGTAPWRFPLQAPR